MIPAALAPHRSFLRFLSARVASTTAQQMLMVALGWQMYELTSSAWDLGLVGFAQFVPALALALVAGHVIDRYPRHRIVAACLILQTLVALSIGTAALAGVASREWILGLSILLGAAKAFQMPAQQALTPQLVAVEVLPRALAFSSGSAQAAIIAGPAIGGFVYAFGASAVYGLSAALFFTGTLLLLTLRIQRTTIARERVSLATVFAGVRFIWHRKPVLGAISLDLFAVLLGGATALLPIFAKDILNTGPWGVGVLRGAPAVGALTMSFALARWPIERRVGRVMFAAVAAYGFATIGFGLSTVFWLSFVTLVVSGAADMVSVVIRQSLVQLDTPDAMRGRVSAVNSIFIGASNQLGEFESGVAAALLGAVGAVVLGGVGTLAIVALWMKMFPELARRQRLLER